ncbi:MAG: outer membrane beta-barrel protein [Paludibacteraceae bacterium]|nr:outer membrane beta-barrel protein [Paludibacteraceae bacterium]
MKKRSIICLALAVLTMSAQAQIKWFSTDQPDKRVTFGAHAGISVSNLTWKNFKGMETDPGIGFVLGGSVDIAIIKSLSVKTGFDIAHNRANYDMVTESYSYARFEEEGTLGSTWIEAPIVPTYHLDINNDMQVQLGFGEYMAFGLGGNINIEERMVYLQSDRAPRKEESDYPFFHNGNFSRFNYGVLLSAGVRWKNIYANLQYRIGLANITDHWYSDDDDDDDVLFDDTYKSNTSTKLNAAYLTVGVCF